MEDLKMVAFFLVFHEIRDSPRKTQKPVTDFRVSAHVAQSAFENTLNWMEEDAGKKIPWPVSTGDISIYDAQNLNEEYEVWTQIYLICVPQMWCLVWTK